MNQTMTEKSLLLRILNADSLENGTLPTHTFDCLGGTLGSRGANWLLHDYSGEIAPIHAEITLHEGRYCLIDRAGRTRLNGAMEPVGTNRIVQLNEGDLLTIGRYRIKASINDEIHRFIGSPHRLSQVEVVELVDAKARHARSHHLLSHGAPAAEGALALQAEPAEDPSASILINEPPKEIVDPLSALDTASQRNEQHFKPLGDEQHLGRSNPHETPANFIGTSREAIHPPRNDLSGETPVMNSTQEETGQPHWSSRYHPNGEDAELNHVVAAPLLKGMQTTLAEMDSAAAHDFLLEAGHTLKAAIEGIQKLYADERKKGLNTALLSRNLQPIEDNPLRLRQDYEATVQSLFSPKRSRVHLSPQAAVSESLAQLDQHQDAIIQAIEESLLTLLRAFSPETLLRRFSQYARTGEAQADNDAWAWQMYSHYYTELISSRQRGFEKLFWEVFEQSYDRAMRQPPLPTDTTHKGDRS